MEPALTVTEELQKTSKIQYDYMRCWLLAVCVVNLRELRVLQLTKKRLTYFILRDSSTTFRTFKRH